MNLNVSEIKAAMEVHRLDEPPVSRERCKGFPDILDPLGDNCGHGTSCAALLLRVAPRVRLWIGRVVDDHGQIPRNNYYGSVVDVI